jgi:hypothetical protein
LNFEHIFDSWCQIFPFHTLAFVFWRVIVDPRLKMASTSLWYRFNRPWKIATRLRLCPPVSCSGIHNAKTLWNQTQSWMIPRA